ncbi:SDA1 domain family protein [Nitzschia inconspicua]|uniref:Protein SDA1 n=1 Tax=Nitzschia inconspicua TaxID=303405 RepID=A0A9K3KCE0_9STRA|nr:SDA1 domain family protein [Nitzschia inconspicua]
MAGGAGTSSSGGGAATGAGTKVDVTLKLPQLQNLCKRDPDGYREDYDAQVRRLESELNILQLSPQQHVSDGLMELIQFAAAVSSSSYKGEESDRIATMLIGLLVGSRGADESNAGNSNQQDILVMSAMLPTSALQLHRDVRKSCVSALILMRNKGALEPLRLLELFFRLMAVIPDKGLREMLYKHMVNDIRNINKKGKRDDKVNRAIQSFLHRVVGSTATSSGESTEEESSTDIAAKRATDMVCELYRRQVWNDDRTVAILASAVQSSNNTVMSRAMRFFLNIEEKMADDQKAQEESEWDASQKIDYHKFSRKTKSRQRHVERQVNNRKKQQRKREGQNTDEWMDVRDDQGVEASKKLYPAIELLRDPQGLAEVVLKKLKAPKSITYKVKLLMMNFVTRLVGNHELMLLNLYPFLQKYMGGHQRDVTAVLAYTVQACHETVPPDEVYGILKTIAHNFVTERCSEEQMAVGINAVRAIVARVPAVLSIEESKESSGSVAFDVEAFVRDIAAYSNHRDRSVSIAGKAFTNFIREAYPSLLQSKDRGLKGAALHRAKTKPLRYGERKVATGVEGADLLAEYESKKAAYLKQKRLQSENGEADDDDDEFEEEEEEIILDSDDEEEAPDLVLVDPTEDDTEAASAAEQVESGHEDEVLDLSKLTPEEREKLKQHVSSTRVFSAAEFVKMRKLVEREERARRDPREAARRKRAIAQGREFEELSGEESDGSEDDENAIHVKGAVNPDDIQAMAKRKRQSKAEKLQKVLAGREAFESKARAGGSTNAEKLRRKNFLMVKSSRAARAKGRGKGGLSAKHGVSAKRGHGGKREPLGHEAKKRRRKY